MTTLVGIEGRF